LQKLSLPIKGVNKGLTVSVMPQEYTTNMNNVRPRDVLEQRIRLGQRPGLSKFSTDRVGADNQPIVFICSVSSIS
jgi:hypothetical protein